MKKKVIKNTLINFLAQFASMGINLYLIAFLIKNLGADQYGLLILLYSLVTATDLFRYGIGSSIVKYVAHYNVKGEYYKINEIVSVGFLFFFIQAIITCSILSIIIFCFIHSIFNVPPEYIPQVHRLGLILLGYLSTELLSTPFYKLLEGFQRYDLLKSMETLKKILLLILAAFIIAIGKGLESIGFAYFLSSLALGTCAIFFSYRVFKFKFGVSLINRNMSKQIISFAWPQFITKLSSFLGNRIDVLLIGIFLTPYYIAVYNVVYQFYLLITTVINLFGSAIFPYVSELYSKNSTDTIKKLYLTGTRYSMFVSIPLVFGAFLLANPFLKAWVGQEYSTYSYLVQIFLIAGILMTSRVMAVQITLSLDLIRHLIKYHFIGAVVNFLISIILIQYIGITGVIVGTVIGYLIVWYPSNSIVLKRLSIKIIDFLSLLVLQPIIAALIAIPFLLIVINLALPDNLLMVLLYGVFYAILFALPFFYIGFNRVEREEMIGLVKHTFISSRII